MPCLSISFSPRLGPLIQLSISSTANGNDPSIAPSALKFSALVDTGASVTSISRTVINALGLSPVGKQPVGGLHGMRATNLYQFVVGLAFPHAAPSAATQLVLFPVLGTEFIPGPAPFEVLLGRDVLCQGILTMTFDGRLTFSV